MDESQRALWILSRPACSEINEAMQELTGTKYVSSEQHKECSDARRDRDCKDVGRLLDFLEDRNPFTEDTELRSIASGVVADKKVNADAGRRVGEKIIEQMGNQIVREFTFKRKDQIVVIHERQFQCEN